MSLEKLPIELIHKIFRCLDYDDILLAFSNLNRYFTKILGIYDRYEINFKSISMCKFNFTLKAIQPTQITSLRLSNLDDTPGQYRLFLLLISFEHLSRLENLEFLSTPNSSQFNLILSNLHTFKYLRSLTIIFCQSTSVNKQTFEILSKFLDQSTSLRRLYLSGCLNHLFDYSFTSSIEHLTFNENIFNTISLDTIANRMPYLKSLHTAVINKIHLNNFECLTRMNLIVFIQLTNSEMKCLLNRVHALTYLTINANGKQWFDGRFWEESLPKNLRKFSFNFCTQSIHVNEDFIFETFRTDFWLVKKRWFILLDYQMNPTMIHLYSLPYCDRQFYYRPTINSDRTVRSTIGLDRNYLKNVKDLTVDLSVLMKEVELNNNNNSSTHYFPNVSNLILSDIDCPSSIEPLFDFLRSILDLNRITQLKLGHFYHPTLISMLHKHMSNLSSLRLTQTLINKFDSISFPNVYRLTICDCLTDFQRIYSIFPNVKYLGVKVTTFEQMKEIMEILDKQLINLTYRHASEKLRKQFMQWLEEQYTDEIQFESDQHMNLHLWLN